MPRTTLVGFREQDRPVLGDMVEVRLTFPAKPLRGATVMIEVPELLCAIITPVELAVTV